MKKTEALNQLKKNNFFATLTFA